MTVTRWRVYSNYDILLEGLNIGNFTVSYFYGYFGISSDSFITVNLYCNTAITTIKNIKIANDWQIYKEKNLVNQEVSHGENIANELLNKIILNRSSYEIAFIARRHIYNVFINRKGLNEKFVLMHEFYSRPPFKQIIMPNNEYKQYGINVEDSTIIEEMEATLMD